VWVLYRETTTRRRRKLGRDDLDQREKVQVDGLGYRAVVVSVGVSTPCDDADQAVSTYLQLGIQTRRL
jgi:hypothetical protein